MTKHSEEVNERITGMPLEDLEALVAQTMKDEAESETTRTLSAICLNLIWELQSQNNRVEELESRTATLGHDYD